MAGRLSGKRAVIYGGGTGLGYACAESMLREGAAVFLSGRRLEKLTGAVARLGAPERVGHLAGDATVEADVVRVTAAAVAFMGGLDTVVISSGTSGVTSIFTASLTEFQRICDANLLSVFLASRHAAEHLVKAGAGSIIAISSMYGLVGQRERAAYCASKAGVIGMVKAMALDFADKGVRANAICPGFIETELAREVAALEADPEAALNTRRMMHAIPRAGRPPEIGALAVYLASDDAAWTTGQAIAVDGGYTMR
jgi:meso-butanediol dehydrogenase/(S,S)-butanediol dehydrogenase/diacetyl reductase